jgi:hypothetical protein
MPLRPAHVLPLSIALALAASLGACGWPEPGGGGLAERQASPDARYDRAHETLDRLTAEGGDRYAAADMIEARLLLNRARREQVGGLGEAANLDLERFKSTIDRIEIRLGARRGPTPLQPPVQQN